MPYSPQDYLLDRFAVEDVARAIWLAVDTHEWSQIPTLVHPKGLLLDYSELLGTPPSYLTGAEVLTTWEPLVTKLTSHQHMIVIAAVDLPVPRTESEQRPMKCTAIGNAFTTMIREGAMGGEEQTSGCRAEVTLERATEDLNDKKWKATGITIVPCWIKGNKTVLAE